MDHWLGMTTQTHGFKQLFCPAPTFSLSGAAAYLNFATPSFARAAAAVI